MDGGMKNTGTGKLYDVLNECYEQTERKWSYIREMFPSPFR